MTLPLIGLVGWEERVLALMLATSVIARWFLARRRLAGTTLTAAWAWTGMALAALVVDALYHPPSGHDPHAAAWSYLVAVTTFAPIMAVLGAKRPQHRAWQFIVATLLVVLALPGFYALAFEQAVSLHAAQVVFIAILLVLAPLNYLPTRFFGAGLLVGCAQVALLGGYLPLLGRWLSEPQPFVALLCVAAAILWVVIARKRRHGSPRPIDRAWLRFRNAYGAVWALRVQERFNLAARQHGWPITLAWCGCVPTPTDALAGHDARRAAIAERTLRMLLLRFVSADWFDQV